LGTDLTPVIAAPDPITFNAELVQALENIAANDYPARSAKLAELIADRLPELVGLQEMFQFNCFNIPVYPGPDCTYAPIAGAFNDHLTLTEANLVLLGEPYTRAAVVNNLDLTGVIVPGLPPGLPVDLNFDGSPDITVTVLDRDVILARPDVATTVVNFPCDPSRQSVDGCNYTTIAKADTPAGTINIERGFVGVDAVVDGKSHRFVNTHLEVQGPIPTPPGFPEDVIFGASIQAAQATELAGLIAFSFVTDPPAPGTNPIVVGDINSSPEDGLFRDPLADPTLTAQFTPPYTQLASGVDLFGTPAPLGPFNDAWEDSGSLKKGFTCCQLADLSNQQSILRVRIDTIFTLQETDRVRKARVLGAKNSDKTGPGHQGLWPSDHGSLAAELQY
jgi:hypothetical protein